MLVGYQNTKLLLHISPYSCYCTILLVHSVSHLLITLLYLSCLHLHPPLPRFLFSPFHIVLPLPVSAGTTGDLVYLLSSWESKLSQSNAANFMAPPPPPPPSLFCVFLSPDTTASHFHHWGDLHGDGPMAERGSPVGDKACGSRAYGVCWVESVTENEQKSRRCWFVLWQGPLCLIRPQSLHSVWHHPNTAYGNEACIWLQLGEIWPPLHKSVQRLQWLWGRVVNQSQ